MILRSLQNARRNARKVSQGLGRGHCKGRCERFFKGGLRCAEIALRPMKSGVNSTFGLSPAKRVILTGKKFLRFFPKTTPDCGTMCIVGLDSRVTVRIVSQNKNERTRNGEGSRVHECEERGTVLPLVQRCSELGDLVYDSDSSVLTVQCCGRDTKRKTR